MSQVQRQDLFTTGEFAALCGVSKHTLFHYDDVGVFSPAVKGENGYRFYSIAQLDVFYVVSVLKELGMPLSEIRAYLSRRSPAELVALLEREDGALSAKIARLKTMQALIRRKAQLTRQAMGMRPGAVTVEEQGERYLVITPVASFATDRAVAVAVAEHTKYCQRHGIVSPYSVGALLDRRAASAGDLSGYTHCCTQVDRRPRGVEVFTLPAGRYLTVCHAGGYDSVGVGYRQLLDWAEARGLALADFFLEDLLLDELSVKGYENYLLRLSIQVL